MARQAGAFYGAAVALVLAAVLGVQAGAAVQTRPIATVELAGQVILRVRDPSSWGSVYARADQIYRRLNEAINTLGQQLDPDQVRVQQVDGIYTLSVGDHLIVSVTPGDARLNRTSPENLAHVWASNLKAALRRHLAINTPSMPPVF